MARWQGLSGRPNQIKYENHNEDDSKQRPVPLLPLGVQDAGPAQAPDCDPDEEGGDHGVEEIEMHGVSLGQGVGGRPSLLVSGLLLRLTGLGLRPGE